MTSMFGHRFSSWRASEVPRASQRYCNPAGGNDRKNLPFMDWLKGKFTGKPHM
jgi:hypothetical protein